ncbi:hypothetical protein D3C81_1815040 [compost metagenome]
MGDNIRVIVAGRLLDGQDIQLSIRLLHVCSIADALYDMALGVDHLQIAAGFAQPPVQVGDRFATHDSMLPVGIKPGNELVKVRTRIA